MIAAGTISGHTAWKHIHPTVAQKLIPIVTAWKTQSPQRYRQQIERLLIEALIYFRGNEKVRYIQLNQKLTKLTAYQGSWQSGEIPLCLATRGQDGIWKTDPKRIQPYVQRLRSLIAYCGKNQVRRGHGITTKSLPLFDKQDLNEELLHLARYGHRGISPQEEDKIRWIGTTVPTCKTGRKTRTVTTNAEDMRDGYLEQEKKRRKTPGDESHNRQRAAETQIGQANSENRYATTGLEFRRPEIPQTSTMGKTEIQFPLQRAWTLCQQRGFRIQPTSRLLPSRRRSALIPE